MTILPTILNIATIACGRACASFVNEPDTYLFDDMAYPPCQCGL